MKILKPLKKLEFSKNLFNLFLVFSFCFFLFISFYYVNFLIWVAFVPALVLMLKNNFYYFWFYLFLLVIIISPAMNFFVKTFSFDYYILSMVFYASLIFISFLLCFLLIKKIRYPYAIFVLPIIWLLVVNFSNLVNGANFWFNYAFLQPQSFPLVWLIGYQGMTFLIMLVNSIFAFCLVKKDKRLLTPGLVILLLVFTCFLYSNFAKAESGKKIKVALIQGNITTSWTDRIAAAKKTVDIYERLSLEVSKENPDIIVWPEYAILADISKDKELYERLANIASTTKANLVLGSVGSTELTDPEFSNIKNITHVFSRNGDYVGGYVSVLPFMQNGKIISGDKFTVFDTDAGKFGITACSEETFSFIAKEYARSGSNFIINVSNDAPFKNLLISKTKAKFSQLSAAENNRYVVRATNNGYTHVINPYGKVIKQIEPNKEGYLIADIYIK